MNSLVVLSSLLDFTLFIFIFKNLGYIDNHLLSDQYVTLVVCVGCSFLLKKISHLRVDDSNC